jgi:hypothetical protein
MKVKKVAVLVSALLGGLFSAQASFAADTKCTVVYWDSDSDTLTAVELNAGNQAAILSSYPPVSTIAVASNFYAPAIDLIEKFTTAAGVGTYSSLGVCHNATGHLADEIKGNNPAVINGEWLSAEISYKYSLFLAADANTPYALFAALDSGGNQLYTLGKVKLYASGIPALLANPARLLTAENLVTDVGAPASAPIGFYNGTDSTEVPVIMNTANLSRIAIGDRVNAPYGAAAAAIINAMGQFSTPVPGGNPSDACTAIGTASAPGICEYDNIAITYDATVDPDSDIDAGWVSWAQIKSANDNSLQFVTFPSYAIAQTGVKLKNPLPALPPITPPPATPTTDDAAAVATALWSFIDLANPNSEDSGFYSEANQTWNEWLADKGYGQLPDPN